MFWYHPHPHGISTSQVAGGLSGALLVGSILKYFPEYEGVRERVLLIRDMSFSLGGGVTPLLNINGSACAKLSVAPGERQLWHIGNFGANTFVNLKLDGMKWTLLALDGNPLAEATEVDSLWIAPGTRAEVIVTGPPAGTRVKLFSAPFAPRTTDTTTLGWVVGEGRARPLRAAPTLAGADKSVLDTIRFLREATDVRRDTFSFVFVGDDSAGVNGRIYKSTDLPVSVPWGQVQEWTIINGTTALHTFHIHQTDFLVVSVNGQPANEGLLRDNVPIGVHPQGSGFAGDTVVVRFIFDPIAAGPFVFHCHVLQHEDEGMMHNVCVYDPKDPDGVNKCNAMFTGAPAH
jgi:FtsP/CotA-like multicopper oxidase with cupredoxin domain